MKKILVLAIISSMLICMCACGGKKTDNGVTSTAEKTVTTKSNSDSDSSKATDNTDSNSSKSTSAESAMIPGTLNFINLDDRDPSVLKGIRLWGNRVGGFSSGPDETINSHPIDTDNIRCIFELNEWVEFYIDSDLEYGLRVWVLEHREDQSYYETAQFSDLMPGFANYCDLRPDPDYEENECWGSFYLHPEYQNAGYYDFVFTYEGKAIATLLTKFYNEGELDLSDEELLRIMNDERGGSGSAAKTTVTTPSVESNDTKDEPTESDDRSVYTFPGYTTEAPWPGPDVWAAMGLPDLAVDDAGPVSISDKEWIYPLNAKDGVLFEARPESSHFDDLVAILNDAGIEGEDNSDSFDSYYEAYYNYNGVDMAIKISEFDTGKLTILVRFLPED